MHGGILGQNVLRTTNAAAYIYYIKNIPCRLTEVLLFMDALRISRGKLRCNPPPSMIGVNVNGNTSVHHLTRQVYCPVGRRGRTGRQGCV